MWSSWCIEIDTNAQFSHFFSMFSVTLPGRKVGLLSVSGNSGEVCSSFSKLVNGYISVLHVEVAELCTVYKSAKISIFPGRDV